jgi:hypothetical protein
MIGRWPHHAPMRIAANPRAVRSRRRRGKLIDGCARGRGKHADAVLIDGDPTRDITTLRNADLVVCRGVIYDPAALAEVVGMRRR